VELSNVVPWGRSFDEYLAMFGLSADDLNKKILGCGDGPASFNAEATERGYRVISCDPVYQFKAEEIRRRINDVYPEIMIKMERGKDNYIWDILGSVERLGDVRMKAMSKFLADFASGYDQGRYVPASLPHHYRICRSPIPDSVLHFVRIIFFSTAIMWTRRIISRQCGNFAGSRLP